MFAGFISNVRFALRLLAKKPAFAAIAIFTIALGIGPNTAIFSLLYAVFWAPGYHQAADRTVVIWTQHPEIQGNGPGGRTHISTREYLEWKRRSTTFESITANSWRQVTLNDDADRPERLTVQPYTPGRFSSRGAPFVLGRDFLPQEGSNGQAAVILSHRYWQSRYDSDPDILEKEVRLNGQPHRIVGVLGPGFWDRVLEPLWPALSITADQPNQNIRSLTVMGVLKPGVTIQQAQAEMDTMSARMAEEFPAGRDWRVLVEHSRNAWLNPRARADLWLLMVAITLVLLIACMNVANLLLARGDSRLREIAVRGALGASKRQLAAQLLTESLVLSTIGGLLGIGLAFGLIKLFLALTPAYSLPPDVDVRLSPWVLAFTMGVTVASGLVFGCAPAWQAARHDAGERLKRAGSRSGRGGGSHRLGKLLVVTEFALALTLLAGASLVTQRYVTRLHGDFGVETENILTFELPATGLRYDTPEEVDRYNTLLQNRLSAVPGVSSVTPVSGLPLEHLNAFRFYLASRGAPATPSGYSEANIRLAGEEFFETFGIRLVSGRVFEPTDRPGSTHVMLVNETFVREFLTGLDPLTQTIAIPTPGEPEYAQIVGVYRDVHNAEEFGGPNRPELVALVRQFHVPFGGFAVRTTGDPEAITSAISAAAAEIDAFMPLAKVRTMRQIIGERTAYDRFETALYGSFGLLSLLLSSVGIYGLMAFVVSQRTPEIGLRMAMGADRRTILGLVFADGVKLAIAGIVVGSLGAWYAMRLLESSLGSLQTAPWLPLAAAVAVLLAAAVSACLLPAGRAARLDPMVALRED